MSDTLTTQVRREINLLREKADFLVQHENFLNHHAYDSPQNERRAYNEITYISVAALYGLEFGVHGPDAKTLTTLLRREIGGRWNKGANDYQFYIHHDVSGTLRVKISADRGTVCEKRVVRTERVTIEATPEQVVEKEIIEWDCGTLLTDDKPEYPDPDFYPEAA